MGQHPRTRRGDRWLHPHGASVEVKCVDGSANPYLAAAALLGLALDGITSASTAPLRVWSYLGASIAFLAICYAVFIFSRTLLLGADMPGYASIMVSILFLGGVQLISLGVLGEYVGRILTETKQRPLYVVRDMIGLD